MTVCVRQNEFALPPSQQMHGGFVAMLHLQLLECGLESSYSSHCS